MSQRYQVGYTDPLEVGKDIIEKCLSLCPPEEKDKSIAELAQENLVLKARVKELEAITRKEN